MQPNQAIAIICAAVGSLAILIGVIVAVNNGGSPKSPPAAQAKVQTGASRKVASNNAAQKDTKTEPDFTALPRTASDQLDVTPTYESAGVVSINEPRGEPPAYIPFTLSSELHGFLLKVNVKASYTPADVRKLKEGIDSIGSVKRSIATSCVELSIEVNGGEYSDYKMTPVASRVQQSSSTATGTLYYPAVLPGEYHWGCGDRSEDPILGKVITENIGVLGDMAVYKVHRARTDTVVLVGAADGIPFTENEPFLSELCLHADEAPSNETWHPAKIKVYHRWLSGESEPYVVAALTFTVTAQQAGHTSLYSPICDAEGEPGIALSGSTE